MPISQIEQVAVGKLRPHPTNVHIHSKKQIAQIANSIGQFGFIDPIIRNESGRDRKPASFETGQFRVPY